MYWEYRTLLVERVAPALLPQLVAEGDAKVDLAFIRRSIEVEDCPDDIDADVSTPFVFKLAAELSTARGELVPPLVVADAALQLLRASGSSLFAFEIGGGGHLNAKRTAEFVPAFFAAALRRGAEVFYATESLLAVPGCVEVGRPLVMDWEHVLADVRVAVGDERDELAELFGRTQGKCELLMVLAAAADPELSLRPFLLGLGGRQNIPWYLDRFQSDAQRFIAEAESLVEPEALRGVLGLEALPVRFHPLLMLLLRLRSRYLVAARRRRPDQLLNHLLALIRAFYTCYNHPSVRALSANEISAEQLPQVLALVNLTRAAILCGVQLIESCCENEGFRLHMRKCG